MANTSAASCHLRVAITFTETVHNCNNYQSTVGRALLPVAVWCHWQFAKYLDGSF